MRPSARGTSRTDSSISSECRPRATRRDIAAREWRMTILHEYGFGRREVSTPCE